MCLELGLRHSCGDINEDARYFVNDLPGISIKRLADTANSDFENAKELFYKILRSSTDIVKNDFLAELSRYKQINSLYDNTHIRLYGTETSGEGFFAFDKLDLEDFTSVYLKSIIVKFNINTDILITITDGTTTTTVTKSVTKGFNVLALNYQFASDSGRVSFTSTDWETGNNMNCNCDSACSNYIYTSNIGFNAFMRVDKDQIVCQYAEFLEYALWWKFGIMTMWEVLNTDRVNYLVDNSKSQAKENIANWDSNDPQNLGDYRKALKQCVESIKDSIKINNEISCSGMRAIKFV